MKQLLLGLGKNKIEAKEKAKEKFCIGDEIRVVKLRPESKKISFLLWGKVKL